MRTNGMGFGPAGRTDGLTAQPSGIAATRQPFGERAPWPLRDPEASAAARHAIGDIAPASTRNIAPLDAAQTLARALRVKDRWGELEPLAAKIDRLAFVDGGLHVTLHGNDSAIAAYLESKLEALGLPALPVHVQSQSPVANAIAAWTSAPRSGRGFTPRDSIRELVDGGDSIILRMHENSHYSFDETAAAIREAVGDVRIIAESDASKAAALLATPEHRMAMYDPIASTSFDGHVVTVHRNAESYPSDAALHAQCVDRLEREGITGIEVVIQPLSPLKQAADLLAHPPHRMQMYYAVASTAVEGGKVVLYRNGDEAHLTDEALLEEAAERLVAEQITGVELVVAHLSEAERAAAILNDKGGRRPAITLPRDCIERVYVRDNVLVMEPSLENTRFTPNDFIEEARERLPAELGHVAIDVRAATSWVIKEKTTDDDRNAGWR
jgi:hypothetical protein